MSTLDEETEFVLDPVLGKTYEGLCDSLRESMDGDRLARATRRGREMQLDETVVFAVELTQSDG